MHVKFPADTGEPAIANAMPVQLHEFSTSISRTGRELDDWNDLISDSFTGLTQDPADRRHFGARMKRAAFGGVVLATPQASTSVVRHTRTHVLAATQDSFILHVQLAGVSLNEQRGRRAMLNPGDFTLCSSLEQYSVQVNGDSQLLVLRVAGERLRRLVPNADDLICLPVRGAGGGVPAIVVEHLKVIWRQLESGSLGRVPAELVESMIQVVSAGLHQERPASAASRARSAVRRRQLLSYVTSRIHDASLTVSGVAKALGMTPRNVSKLMQEEGLGLAAFILDQRLQGTALWLHEPAYAHLTVSEVAYGWGFSDLSHFYRAFRERFGQSPGQYRSGHRTPGH